MVDKANTREQIKRQKLMLVLMGIILVAGVGTVIGLRVGGIWGAVTPVDTTYTEYVIIVSDELDSSNTDDFEAELTYAWYSVDISGMDEDEIDDLTWADFSADGSGNDKDYDEDKIWIVRIYDVTSSDIVETYLCSDYRIAEGKIPLLQLGNNYVDMYNFTEDASVVAYARDGGVTLNQTNDRVWNVLLTSLDATEGTGLKTFKEGYKGYFDPSTNKYSTVTAKFTFNTTASTSWLELQDSYTNRETASGSYLYIEIDVDLYGTLETEWKFSSALGTDFEVITVAMGYGNADSFTAWDSQS